METRGFAPLMVHNHPGDSPSYPWNINDLAVEGVLILLRNLTIVDPESSQLKHVPISVGGSPSIRRNAKYQYRRTNPGGGTQRSFYL